METSEKLLELRIRTESDEEEAVLLSYLTQAKWAILNQRFPYRTDFDGMEVEPQFEDKQIEIAAYMMNKRGAEGEIQHIENGTHRNYGNAGVPDDMLSDITPFCGGFQ